MNSLKVLYALHHLSVRHAGVCRLTVESVDEVDCHLALALKDDYDRPGQHWLAFYIDEHSTGTYFDSYEACRPWTQDSSYDFAEIPPRVAGIQ